MKIWRGGGLAVWLHAFLTSALNGHEWSVPFLDFVASLDSWNCEYCGEERNFAPARNVTSFPRLSTRSIVTYWAIPALEDDSLPYLKQLSRRSNKAVDVDSRFKLGSLWRQAQWAVVACSYAVSALRFSQLRTWRLLCCGIRRRVVW